MHPEHRRPARPLPRAGRAWNTHCVKDLSRRATLLVSFGYDGGPFFGLQPQPDRPTAGGALQARLTAAAGQGPRGLAFAARTDRGVHALHNIATCWFPVGAIDPALLATSLMASNDEALWVRGVWRVDASVHARNVALAKHYRYVVDDQADVSEAQGSHRRAWSVVPYLDVDAMQRAATQLVGTFDFTSLRGGGCSAGSPIKTVARLDVSRAPRGPAARSQVVIDVEGDAFLRHMVRNLAGLLVEVGGGCRHPASITEVIAARERQAAGLQAPAGGLTLMALRLRDMSTWRPLTVDDPVGPLDVVATTDDVALGLGEA
jgi:tRNA pseudouridine38-40 synthase